MRREGTAFANRPKTGDWYKRLGACINTAIEGATEGERASGQAAVNRLLALLSPAELRVLQQGLPGISQQGSQSQTQYKPSPRHRVGTKREAIITMLSQGFKPKDIALHLGCRVQYVHRIKKELRDGV